MTQTLRRERRLKFEGILTGKLLHESELSLLCELLADAATSESERRTDETFGEYNVKPNIFTIYEQNIGVLTPMLSDQLSDIEKDYPEGWFEDAVKEALKNNVRKLAYIVTILDRWKTQGRGDKKQAEQIPVTYNSDGMPESW